MVVCAHPSGQRKDNQIELARMLGGQTEAARKHAEVLLKATA